MKQIKRFTASMLMLVLFCSLVFPATISAKSITVNRQTLLQTYLQTRNIQVTPQFKSGGSTHTHQYIVTKALSILQHDKGYTILNQYTNSNTLKTYTDWPDKVGNETDNITYSGHFYNPYTEKTWTGSKTKTAMTRAISYFNNALAAAKEGNMTEAFILIGKGTHYVSDMNEPHHASNLTAFNSNHTAFEKYVDENLSSINIPGNTFAESYYAETQKNSMYNILREGAFYAYDLQYIAQEKDTYQEAAEKCVKHAILNVTQYLYAFGVEAGIYH